MPNTNTNTPNEFTPQLDRMLKAARQRMEELKAFLATQPQDKACAVHPDVTRKLDAELSAEKSARTGEKAAAYTPCPNCIEGQRAKREQDFLHRAGVLNGLLHGTLDNWTPRTEEEQGHLRAVKRFAKAGRGFLIMLGAVGAGKTHLAVGVARLFRSPKFVQQNTLLRELRASYRDGKAQDPIEPCQRADLLIIDDMGLSSGGRDELPMLHEILNHRHGEYLPTILTGNLNIEQMKALIGERLTDRLSESVFSVLQFGGPSYRPQVHDRYFGNS